jgi:uncharacterized protein YndB with AHSA1/START domain
MTEALMVEGDDVVHELTLGASPESVFAMFVEPGNLVRWIGISAELDPQPGGTFRFEVMPGQFCEGRFVEVEPPVRLSFSWGWTDASFGLPPGSSLVEVTFEPVPGGTHLRLVHRDLPDDDNRLLHDDGWGRFLARLEAAEGEQPSPVYPSEQPSDRLRALREEGRT